MPFKSENQRKFLWAKHPDIAQRWSDEYGSKPVDVTSPQDGDGAYPFDAMKKEVSKKGKKKKKVSPSAAKRLLMKKMKGKKSK